MKEEQTIALNVEVIPGMRIEGLVSCTNNEVALLYELHVFYFFKK
jgi:hypothetical protein